MGFEIWVKFHLAVGLKVHFEIGFKSKLRHWHWLEGGPQGPLKLWFR